MTEIFTVNSNFLSMIGYAMLCGGLIGLERQIHGKPAGMRTSMLVCLGTAVFVNLGATLSGPALDPARVLGQVVTGIGFLGAGVMFTNGGSVLGVTTAAVIWMLAAVGAAVGLGMHDYAVMLAITTLVILICTEWLEKSFEMLQRGAHSIYKRRVSKESLLITKESKDPQEKSKIITSKDL
jgi:putative Mg2+ transporter-C (MgtC) family protein